MSGTRLEMSSDNVGAFSKIGRREPRPGFSAPLSIDFDITLSCNQRCLHCNVDAGNRLPNELTAEEAKAVITEAWEMGVWDIAITGGEALMRKDWFEIVSHACSFEGWNVQLNTNGILWNEETITRVAEKCPELHVIVSLDGNTPDAYAILRKDARGEADRRGFARTVENLEFMVRHLRIPPAVNFVLTRLTIPYFFKTAEFVDSIGVNGLLGIKFFPYGRGQTYSDLLDLSYDEWKRFMVEATERKKRELPKIQISAQAPWEMFLPLLEAGYSRDEIYSIWNYYRSPLSTKSFRTMCSDLGCNAGFTYCAIGPDGDVYPCGTTVGVGYEELSCGNVRDGGLAKIWKESRTLGVIRCARVADVGQPCVSCELKDICGCGCRGRAFKATGKYTDPDSWCPRVQRYLRRHHDAAPT